ncbi:MAG: alpha/beta hydrolase family protein [Myxococcales bacterium]|nr:alpha/beta hydrolase family protein [Myxococcales bacterium]
MDRRTSHLIDDAIGLLSRLMNGISPPHPNTLAELSVYEGRAVDEIFPAPRIPEEVTFQKRWAALGLVCEDLCFESGHQPLCPTFKQRHADEYPSNHFVYARWLRHVGGPRRPTFLYVHGWMQFEPIIEEFTLLPMIAKRLDMNVIHIQLPYHGRRKPPGAAWHGEYFWTADMVRTVEALRQSVLDARALRAWLASQGQNPVGVGGLSLGGVITEVLACVDADFDFAVPIIAHMDLARAMEEAPILYRMREELKGYGWDHKQLDDFLRAAGWHDLRPVIPRERIFMIAAEHDKFLTPERVRALWKSWGEPPIYWFPGGHTGFLPYMWEYLGAAKRFFESLGDRPRADGE